MGLWLNKRWAEYLTFIATSLLIPYEIYELYLRVSVLKVVAFVLNVLVVAYLLYAKRLFGVRGGHAAEVEAEGGAQRVEGSSSGPRPHLTGRSRRPDRRRHGGLHAASGSDPSGREPARPRRR